MRFVMRPTLAGLATYVAILAVLAVFMGACKSSRTNTVTVYVHSQAAGLVMNKNAPVTWEITESSDKGKVIEVGKVVSTNALPNGQTNLELALDASQLHFIPANVLAKVTPPTGVRLYPPQYPVSQRLKDGTTITAD